MDFELDASADGLDRLIVELVACREKIYRMHEESAYVLKGALAHRTGFWLVALKTKDQVTVEEVLWNAKGSAARLTEFFAQENPTAKVLDQLLLDMRLRLYDGQVGWRPAWLLGSGRQNNVFRVRADDGRSADGCMALKVVAGSENICKLEQEFERNQAICERAPGVMVKAIDFRLHGALHTVGAGMLMDEVGSAVPRSEAGGLWKALSALAELHSTGYCHGSARLDNLLACGGRYKWCDAQRSSILGPGQECWLVIFVRSCFRFTYPFHRTGGKIVSHGSRFRIPSRFWRRTLHTRPPGSCVLMQN
jgi:hypothetical protein